MEINDVAKRLLTDGKSCIKCKWNENGKCGFHEKEIPDELICDKYIPPGGLKIKWSVRSELDLKSAFCGISAEEELINAARKELKEDINLNYNDEELKKIQKLYGRIYNGDLY